MLSLKNIENAIDKDDPNGLYKWGKLFAATTWEEIKMIVENNNYMKSMASGIRELTADEKEAEIKRLKTLLDQHD